MPPAGASPNVTPTAPKLYNLNDYTFNVQAQQVNLQLAVDANRDGTVAFDATDRTSAARPYQFWVNDNHDGYASSSSGIGSVQSLQEDLDLSTGNDATSNTISCTRDLEDYARLWMNVQGITNELQNGTFLLALQWEGVTGNPAIRIFPAVEPNGGTLYLTDTNIALAQITSPFNTNIVDHTGQETAMSAAPFFFTTNVWQNFATNPLTYLLFVSV
jgi:hypothetical protein